MINLDALIEKWDLCDWENTLEAYKTIYPDNLAFIRKLTLNPSEANVRIALQTLKNSLNEKIIQKPAKTPTQEEVIEVQADLKNEEYIKLEREMQFLYNSKSKLSNSLHEYAPHQNAERALVVTNIIALRDQYNMLAVRKKYYLQFGQMPIQDNDIEKEEERQAEMTLAELRIKLKNLHTNKSKAEKSKKNAVSEGKKIHYTEKICQLEAEIKNINNQITKLRNGKDINRQEI